MLSSPYFPLDYLKENMMALLTEAVQIGGAHIRDPIGGSNACLFVYVHPIFMLCEFYKARRVIELWAVWLVVVFTNCVTGLAWYS